MDVYAGDPTPTGLSLDARVGGSPFNVATGLARLGRPTAWFGGLLALTMAVAFLSEVFILPAAIKLLPRFFAAERLRRPSTAGHGT